MSRPGLWLMPSTFAMVVGTGDHHPAFAMMGIRQGLGGDLRSDVDCCLPDPLRSAVSVPEVVVREQIERLVRGPGQVVPLPVLADTLLDQARGHTSGRAAITVASGSGLRATVIAMTEGTELSEHDSHPSATLQILRGSVRLHSANREWVIGEHAIVTIPPQRHGLTAISDAVILLTVAL
jgi:quercetin dioxygenase-like cupin family protein